MRAVVLRSHGGPESLTIEDVPDPVGGPEDVVVKVRATALNRGPWVMGYQPPRSVDTGLSLRPSVGRARLWTRRHMGISGGGAERIAPRAPASGRGGRRCRRWRRYTEVFLTAWDALSR